MPDSTLGAGFGGTLRVSPLWPAWPGVWGFKGSCGEDLHRG